MVTTVGPSTSCWSRPKALRINLRRSSFSFSSSSDGSPTGFGTARPCTIRLTPTICAMLGMAVIWTTGIPIFSRLDASVAPQRVEEPQVEVRMAPEIVPRRRISSPISSPISPHRLVTVQLPLVEKNVSWSFPTFPSFTSSRSASTGTRR